MCRGDDGKISVVGVEGGDDDDVLNLLFPTNIPSPNNIPRSSPA